MTELDNLFQHIVAADKHDDTKYRTADDVFREFFTGVEIAEAEFVADFLSRMFAANYFARSNSKKAAMFSIFVEAVMAVALSSPGNNSPADRLEDLIGRAEFWIFDEPNPRRFHDCIIAAFERSKFRQFSELAEALRRQESAESIRRLAMQKTFKRR